MISCAEAVRQLWEYLDNTLDPEDQERVDSHLAFCRRCCGELEFAEEMQHFLRSKKAAEVPLDAQARLERFIDSLERKEKP
jgi:anti-sigma factor (TIGR02949 family)